MNPRRISTFILTVALGAGAWSLANSEPQKPEAKPAPALEKSPATGESLKPVVKSEDEWKKQLTPEQFRILRNEGTERAFTGQYAKSHGDGIYRCAGCGLSLFDSRTKFESGTGWPSYTSPVHASHIREVSDRSFGWNRVEVECARCGGHLGHVFDDGPAPTGLRYCINSASLTFEARAGK